MKLLYFFLLFSFANYSYAQDTIRRESFAVSSGVAYSINNYDANFSEFEKIVNCKNFTDGGGNGLQFYIMPEMILNDLISINLNFRYADRSGDLQENDLFPTYNPYLDQLDTISTELVLDSKLNYLEFSPGINLNLINYSENKFRIGTSFIFSIPMGSSFEQNEKIVSPSYASFIVNGQRLKKRTLAKGDYSSVNSLYGFSFSAENLLKISEDMYFTQKFSFDYFLNDIIKDVDWKHNSVNISLGLRYTFKEELILETPELEITPIEEIKDTLPILADIPDTVVSEEIKTKLPKKSLEMRFLETDYRLESGKELLSSIPLVNAVFFEENSSEIKEEYKSSATNINLFKSDPISAHYSILDIITQIVNDNPRSSIEIQGASSGSKFENNPTKLAKERANAVKNEFLKRGIDASKIKISFRAKPINPSNDEFEKGRIENQRADIILKNAKLQKYVSLDNYKELHINHSIQSKLKNIPDDLSLYINNSNNESKIINHKTDTSNFKSVLDVKDDNKFSFNYDLSSRDTTFLSLTHKVDIDSLEENVKEFRIENFEAILRFDYNSSRLSMENKNLIKELCQVLPENTRITLIGSTDILGSDKRNNQLQQERARATQKFINQNFKNKFVINIEKSSKKFSDETIQGRFLNRSIRIKLSTD